MRRMTLRTQGLAEAAVTLAKPGERAADMKPALEASVLHWQRSEQRRFRRGWKQSPEWAREKRRRGLDGRSMRATGQAEAALTNANRSAGVLARATRTSLVVGVVPGRSDIYYIRALAQTRPRSNAVVFDKRAKEATGVTVLNFLITGVARAEAS